MIFIDGQHLASRNIESVSLITHVVDPNRITPKNTWCFIVTMVSGNRYKYTASYDECAVKRDEIMLAMETI